MFSCSLKQPDWLRDTPSLCPVQGLRWSQLDADHSPLLATSLRMSAAIPPLHLYAFMALTETLYHYLVEKLMHRSSQFLTLYSFPLLNIIFLIIKSTRCTNFSNIFWNETLHVSDSSSVHHQEFFTVHKAMVYVTQVCRQLSSRIRMELDFHSDPACMLSTKLYDIYQGCVYSEKLLMMDRGTV
jgi:hypothetical protein